ncbi:alginate lyase family protein [Rudanella lutea]|uniref:alginate lyase family protein n=1 Tax=Rudanella lutea TaxID=451374 RepID=UPI0003A013FC|nr:alginate lyase family protein [Rudanella lutea]
MDRKLMEKLAFYGLAFLWLLGLPASAQNLRKPTTFLLNAELLQANKTKIKQGDPVLKAAQQAFLAIADKTLTKPTYSVVNKSKVPPSGDKHDYMSVGPYWWPDSTKPDGLPYIRKDGQINPERYAIQDDAYMNGLCNDVQTLAIAYYFSDNEKYARRAAELLWAWFLDPATKMNPNLNFGQAIPGITQGRGIGLIDSRELAVLADAVQLIRGSSAWSEADHQALQDWFRQFLDWMLTSPIGKDEEDEHNNHGTYYDFQTVAYALFTDNKPLAKQIIEQKTYKRIGSQLTPEGSQPHELARTLSWNYSVMNLQGFFGIAQLADNLNLDVWHYETPDGKSLQKAFFWLLPYAEGKKSWTHKQIKAMHPENLWPMALVAAGHYKLETLPAVAHEQASKQPLFTLTQSLF